MPARRVRARAGEDRLDGGVHLRGRVDGYSHDRARGRGRSDYSLESAICKVAGTEYIWYAANRVLQLKAARAYMRRRRPYEKVSATSGFFPIFEGANDRDARVRRALSGMKRSGEKLRSSASSTSPSPSALSECWRLRRRRVQREVRAEPGHARALKSSGAGRSDADQVKRLRSVSESLLRSTAATIVKRQFQQSGSRTPWPTFYARWPCSRASRSIFEDQGVEPSGQERYIAETSARAAAARVTSNLDQIESNDDERMTRSPGSRYKPRPVRLSRSSRDTPAPRARPRCAPGLRATLRRSGY